MVLIAKSPDFNGGYREFVETLDLSPSGPQTFTGNLDRLFLGPGRLPFELAVVIDGQWLIDPLTDRHNFSPDLLAPVRR